MFFRQKIIRNYEDSCLINQKIRQEYEESKKIFEELNNKIITYLNASSERQQNLSNAELNALQQQLKSLPKLAFEYANNLRNLKNRSLTIKVNRDNYDIRIRKISQLNPHEDLSYLSFFSDKISKTMQEQIEVDLGYAENSLNVIDKAIPAFNSIVEIERTKRDRTLERTIQILGVAIGTGGIVASGVSGHITTPISFQPTWKLETLHPAFATLCVSLIAALISGSLVWWITKQKQ